MHAVSKSRLEVVNVLLEAGANKGVDLLDAVRKKKLDFAICVLMRVTVPLHHLRARNYCVNAHYSLLQRDRTALILAVERRVLKEVHFKIVTALLQAGADPTFKTRVSAASHVEIFLMHC